MGPATLEDRAKRPAPARESNRIEKRPYEGRFTDATHSNDADRGRLPHVEYTFDKPIHLLFATDKSCRWETRKVLGKARPEASHKSSEITLRCQASP